MPSPSISLVGNWLCALDAAARGHAERWHRHPPAHRVQVRLPNTTDLLGLGEPVLGSTTAHPTRRCRHVGPVWWWHEFVVPEGQEAFPRWEIFLERGHGRTEAWLDDAYLGLRDSLGTPLVFAVGKALSPGRHRLVLCTDNREHLPVGLAPEGQGSVETVAHSTSEHTQSNWNGVVGRMELRARPARWLRRQRVTTSPDLRGFELVYSVGNDRDAGPASLRARLWDGPALLTESTVEFPVESNHRIQSTREGSLTLDLGGAAALWSEYHPKLYRLEIRLESAAACEVRHLDVGLRHARREGRALWLNDQRLFLRGALDCCQFPLTGHPPMTPEPWRAIFRTVRQHGLNHVRFHSWCPPEAAFVAADELGIYLQVECGVWGMVGVHDELDRFVLSEGHAILDAYGHHPSFVILCHGNEPLYEESRWWLADWVRAVRFGDHGRLFASAAGWSGVEPADVMVGSFTENPHPGAPVGLRLHLWGAVLDGPLASADHGTLHEFPAARAVDYPYIAHEVGQWMAYPDVAEAQRWSGPLEARNLQWFGDDLVRVGLADQAGEFLHASGRLQVLCYKTEIEAQLATPEHAGFQLLGLTDFTGQGTATVGVLNAFWEGKGYHTPAEFRAFCGDCVPLARFARHTWSVTETFTAEARLAFTREHGLRDAALRWTLRDAAGSAVREGQLEARDFPPGVGQEAGSFTFAWSDLPAPARYRLELALDAVCNAWDLWLYPTVQASAPVAGVRIFETLDADVEAHLAAGGRALVLLDPACIDNPVRSSWAPVFWNTAWTGGQDPQSHGLVVRAEHQAFAAFPTETWACHPWHDLVMHSRALVLDHLPTVRPLVQPIDDCYRNRRLGLLVETRVGTGHLILSGLDLRGDLGARPAAAQLRRSLLSYLASRPDLPTAVSRWEDWVRCLRR